MEENKPTRFFFSDLNLSEPEKIKLIGEGNRFLARMKQGQEAGSGQEVWNRKLEDGTVFKLDISGDIDNVKITTFEKGVEKEEEEEEKERRKEEFLRQFPVPVIEASLGFYAEPTGFYVSQNFYAGLQYISKYIPPDKDGKAQIRVSSDTGSASLTELDNVGEDLMEYSWVYDVSRSASGFIPGSWNFPVGWECAACGGYCGPGEVYTSGIGEPGTPPGDGEVGLMWAYGWSSGSGDDSAFFFNHYSVCRTLDYSRRMETYIGANNPYGGGNRITVNFGMVQSWTDVQFKLNDKIIKSFPPHIITKNNYRWGEAVYYPMVSARGGVEDVEGTALYLEGNAVWGKDEKTKKDRYVYLRSEFWEEGGTWEDIITGDMSYFGTGYVFRNDMSPPSSGPQPVKVYVTTDETEDFLILETESDDVFWTLFVDVFDYSSEPVYMYSLWSEKKAIIIYGFIYNKEHHRITFSGEYDKDWPRHSFDSATYESMDGGKKAVTFPDKLKSLYGYGKFRADKYSLSGEEVAL